jgi:hypothetical protein
MKKYILIIYLLCPVMVLKQKCKEQDISPGHLYHEESEALGKISNKRLFQVLEEDAVQAQADCFEIEEHVAGPDFDDL